MTLNLLLVDAPNQHDTELLAEHDITVHEFHYPEDAHKLLGGAKYDVALVNPFLDDNLTHPFFYTKSFLATLQEKEIPTIILDYGGGGILEREIPTKPWQETHRMPSNGSELVDQIYSLAHEYDWDTQDDSLGVLYVTKTEGGLDHFELFEAVNDQGISFEQITPVRYTSPNSPSADVIIYNHDPDLNPENLRADAIEESLVLHKIRREETPAIILASEAAIGVYGSMWQKRGLKVFSNGYDIEDVIATLYHITSKK